jgi:predicted ferric reductase
MSKKTFILLYILSPLIPICIYLISIGWNGGVYSISVALGICAFVLVCNQLILASRPAFIVKALGQKGLRTLHSAVPAAIIVIAVTHRFLKAAAGFDIESFRADLGGAGLVLIVALSVVAFVFIAAIGGKLGDRLKAFRAKLAKNPGISYKGSRAFHAAAALAVPLLCVHLLLASSADFSRNPIGASWLAIYAIISIYLFLMYRISGRSPGKEKK